ncbi:MAG: 2-C-methyl-D-erythritol 2,4-cyclodiphosphate synthase [Candidatus Margulisbacteria bacterium]|nr:2-C-methyl-D-erythritol 2,4-cyclodiphosphate synthase [Candidatus Margulisiibacteriota bacterium]
MRVGIGYDAHQLVKDRKLILGGVDIKYSKGLLGHSDADVLTHAIMDAILGAAGLGTIGQHFPDTDKQYKDISSLVLLDKAFHLVNKLGFEIANIDAVVVAEKPKLAPYFKKMSVNLANILKVPESHVNIKATTTEGLGFAGRKEGIAAQAVCLLHYYKKD